MPDIDREALEHASKYYGIPLDDPDAETILRRSWVFDWYRLRLAVLELGRNVEAALPRWFRRR